MVRSGLLVCRRLPRRYENQLLLQRGLESTVLSFWFFPKFECWGLQSVAACSEPNDAQAAEGENDKYHDSQELGPRGFEQH